MINIVLKKGLEGGLLCFQLISSTGVINLCTYSNFVLRRIFRVQPDHYPVRQLQGISHTKIWCLHHHKQTSHFPLLQAFQMDF